MDIQKAYYKSDIGYLEITGTEKGISEVNFIEEKPAYVRPIHPCLQECYDQLDEYFRGVRRNFDLNIVIEGTDFQIKVWMALLKIPFGTTLSYGEIAKAVGSPRAVRAVGGANGRNRISVIIPCHRVIRSDGRLGGYGSGTWRKDWLLKHETKVLSFDRQVI
jgi:methylated-DNA-[protein]-cysteine S-methyltransferase